MRTALRLLPVVASALVLAACGGAGSAITFKLDPRDGSGLDAVATLGPASLLSIDLTDAAPRGLTAAVYRGSCAELPDRRVSATVPVRGTQARLRVDLPHRAHQERAVALKRNGVMLACGDVPPGPAA